MVVEIIIACLIARVLFRSGQGWGFLFFFEAGGQNWAKHKPPAVKGPRQTYSGSPPSSCHTGPADQREGTVEVKGPRVKMASKGRSRCTAPRGAGSTSGGCRCAAGRTACTAPPRGNHRTPALRPGGGATTWQTSVGFPKKTQQPNTTWYAGKLSTPHWVEIHSLIMQTSATQGEGVQQPKPLKNPRDVWQDLGGFPAQG